MGDYDPVYSKNGQMIAFAGVPPTPPAPQAAGHVTNPESVLLAQNHPNPFRDATTIRIEIPEADVVELQIFDAEGILVKTLASDTFEPGTYELEWDGTGPNGQFLPSGIYTCQLRVGKTVQMKRMVMIGK